MFVPVQKHVRRETARRNRDLKAAHFSKTEVVLANRQAAIEQLLAEVARLEALVIKALGDHPSQSQVCMSTRKLVLSLVSGRLPTDLARFGSILR